MPCSQQKLLKPPTQATGSELDLLKIDGSEVTHWGWNEATEKPVIKRLHVIKSPSKRLRNYRRGSGDTEGKYKKQQGNRIRVLDKKL